MATSRTSADSPVQSSTAPSVEPGIVPVTEPGTILLAHGDELAVSTGAGTLFITELQAEGRRASRTREFLAGHRLTPGQRFRAHP